jgi:hypothetical protein
MLARGHPVKVYSGGRERVQLPRLPDDDYMRSGMRTLTAGLRASISRSTQRENEAVQWTTMIRRAARRPRGVTHEPRRLPEALTTC